MVSPATSAKIQINQSVLDDDSEAGDTMTAGDTIFFQ
jgi:hypothetical protein